MLEFKSRSKYSSSGAVVSGMTSSACLAFPLVTAIMSCRKISLMVNARSVSQVLCTVVAILVLNFSSSKSCLDKVTSRM